MRKNSSKSHKNRVQEEAHGPNSPASKSRRIPLWQALVLPVAAVLIFFLLLEGGLALFGVKPVTKSEDPFVGFASNAPLFVPSQSPGDAGRMVTASNKLQFFNQQSFAKEKAPDSYRIFTLGGSTTYGRPYGDVTSFSGTKVEDARSGPTFEAVFVDEDAFNPVVELP